MKETKKEILAGITADRSKVIAPNTVEYYRDGTRHIRLHHTDVLIFTSDAICIDSGGWHTNTTRDRINSFLPSGYHLVSEKGLWIVRTPKNSYPFKDCMVIDLDSGVAQDVPSLRLARKEYNEQKKKVSRFIDLYAEKLFSGKMEKPGACDCFSCALFNTNNPTNKDKDHLLSHIEETYLVPSLIWLAIAAVGASIAFKHDVAALQSGDTISLFFRDDKEIKRCLKRFFRQQGVL